VRGIYAYAISSHQGCDELSQYIDGDASTVEESPSIGSSVYKNLKLKKRFEAEGP
jgi:hypothetical protein